jgi:hydroxymethylpyrimidine/phosphomethylpyrimidine kinase
MVSKGGFPLLQVEARKALSDHLLPIAAIVTPNIPEAETITGVRIKTRDDMKEAARIISALGPRYVLIKGGHLPEQAVDILFDGAVFYEFSAENCHKSYARYRLYPSSAIAASLAKGWIWSGL